MLDSVLTTAMINYCFIRSDDIPVNEFLMNNVYSIIADLRLCTSISTATAAVTATLPLMPKNAL